MEETTYLAPDAKLPYCRGCGHALVVRQLSQALETLRLPPRSVVLTTDIGCVGLADSLFPFLHTVHTTHGRSTAMATGMALADAVLSASGLKPVVLIGDGGAMIGLLHLIHAAQLNVDVTVLVHNNFLFGMTGGQHSAFTPMDWITSTTPQGNLIPPLDILALLRTAHTGYVARQLATDGDLGAVIAEAIRFPGFSLVEILEVCTGYGGLKNKSAGSALREVAARPGYVMGRMVGEQTRPTFAEVYQREKETRAAEQAARSAKPSDIPLSARKDASGGGAAGVAEDARRDSSPESPNSRSQISDLKCQKGFQISDFKFQKRENEKLHVVIAGSAGERVQSSAALLCRAALSVGLYATQKNDNPVTQGSGFSLSEICLSTRPIEYTGMERVDVAIAVSPEGWNELQANGTLSKLTPATLLLLDSDLGVSPTTGRWAQQPFRREAGPKRAALAAIAYWLAGEPAIPRAAWDTVVCTLPMDRREEVAAALRVGAKLAEPKVAASAATH
jgi:pyruvate/2-oxoacid:ferredoxin oxidoreductase beta subunit/Pyruvate/2-oxoacid:ferredoxin oxidoreductase gamma subunit